MGIAETHKSPTGSRLLTQNFCWIKPDANVPADTARHQLRTYAAPEAIALLQPALARFAEEQGERLLEAHRRVRTAAGGKGRIRIESSPPDILGLYVFLPKPTTE